MNATEDSWTSLLEELRRTWESLCETLVSAREAPVGWKEIVQLGRPVEPFDGPGLLGSVVGLAGVVAGFLLLGVALSSLGALLVSLLALGFLLHRVFGISIEIEPPPGL